MVIKWRDWKSIIWPFSRARLAARPVWLGLGAWRPTPDAGRPEPMWSTGAHPTGCHWRPHSGRQWAMPAPECPRRPPIQRAHPAGGQFNCAPGSARVVRRPIRPPAHYEDLTCCAEPSESGQTGQTGPVAGHINLPMGILAQPCGREPRWHSCRAPVRLPVCLC